MISTLARWMILAAFGLAAHAQEPKEEESLRIEGAVVCRSIEGFEDYEILPDAELTSDEKLLVYYRPKNYKSAPGKGGFVAHFTQDGQVRAAGKKKVLLRKAKLLDYEASSRTHPENVFIRNTFSLKGLPPGDYEYDVILRDENAPKEQGSVTASVKFRVVPAKRPEPEKGSE
jgi:hypothetical protein